MGGSTGGAGERLGAGVLRGRRGGGPVALRPGLEGELLDEAVEVFGECIEFRRRPRHLFDVVGRFVGHLGDRLDAFGDLVARGGLLFGRRRDAADAVGNALGAVHDFLEGVGRLSGEFDAGFNFTLPLLDRPNGFAGLVLDRPHHVLDLVGGLCRALGQLAHLLGHDREALSGLAAATVAAGPGCLDGGVQREQVRLVGNLVDRSDDLADLLARLAELTHRLRGVFDHRPNLAHLLDGLEHHLTVLAPSSSEGPGARREQREVPSGANDASSWDENRDGPRGPRLVRSGPPLMRRSTRPGRPSS
mgnify:CR=1 FL=1